MEDQNQMHGSTQTNELINSGECKDDIANKIGIKDFFPKTKKVLVHKNHKNQLEPLEILNKFRKKVFGVSDFQKKLTFKAKKDKKKLKLENSNHNLALEVKKLSAAKSDKNNFAGTHSFFQISDKNHIKDKKTFITDLNKLNNLSKSKPKKLFFNKAKDEAPDSDTAYSSYVLKDFACPNKNEYDVNLNYNTFYVLFNKEKKFYNEKKFNAKNLAEFEKEKKLIHKIERRIQTEFLQKISFPPNEKFMNKTANNFNFNKGLFKINELRGSLTSADRIRSSLSPSNKHVSFPSNNVQDLNKISCDNNNNNNNFNKTANYFPMHSTNKFNFTAQNFHKKNYDLNSFNNKLNKNNNNSNNSNNNINFSKQKSISPNRAKRRNTSEAYSRNDYYTRNHLLNDLDKLNKIKHCTQNDYTEHPYSLSSNGSKQNLNAHAQTYLHPEKSKFTTQELNQPNCFEKKLYTFNLNQASNAHVLHMLRLNQMHEKLGLTKRAKLGPSNGLKEKVLREKLKNNLDGIVKRQQNFYDYNKKEENYENNKNYLKNKDEINNNNAHGLSFNVTFNTINNEKSKFLHINNNLFKSSEIPDEEKKYYEYKKDDFNVDKDNQLNNKNITNSNNNNEHYVKKSDLDNSELKNLEKFSVILNEETSNNNNNTNINHSLLNNKIVNKAYADKIEALNEEYENKTSLNNNLNIINNKASEGDQINTQPDANTDKEGVLFEEKSNNLKKKEMEINDLVSSAHASMEKIISKKTFENVNENLINANAELYLATKNDEFGNNAKKNVNSKSKQVVSLIKNSNNNIESKIAKGNKTTLLNRQANNQDLLGLQNE